MNEIRILIDDAPQTGTGAGTGPVTRSGTLGGTSSGALGSGSRPRVESVATDKLQSSLRHLTDQLRTMLVDIKEVGDFQLSEIELQAEISADGFVLVGKAGLKGAVTLKFVAK